MNILKKINAVMSDLDAIGKTSVNAQQGFKFRGIDAMLNSFKPLLTKHGVVMTVDTLDYTAEIKDVVRSSGKQGVDKHVKLLLKYTFHSVDDGSSISSTVPAEGLDSGDKATTKALSLGLKYCLIQTFTVPTEDIDDGDSDSPTIGSKATKESPSPLVESSTDKPVATERPKFERPKSLSNWSK